MESEISSDDGHAFKLLLSCPSGLSPSQVSVEFDQLDMIPYQDSDLRNSISEIWDPRVEQSSSFYNGLKFRNELENMVSKMPGCHRGGFALYKLMVQGMMSS